MHFAKPTNWQTRHNLSGDFEHLTFSWQKVQASMNFLSYFTCTWLQNNPENVTVILRDLKRCVFNYNMDTFFSYNNFHFFNKKVFGMYWVMIETPYGLVTIRGHQSSLSFQGVSVEILILASFYNECTVQITSEFCENS